MRSGRFAGGVALEILAVLLLWSAGNSWFWMLYLPAAAIAFVAGVVLVAGSPVRRVVKIVAAVWPFALGGGFALFQGARALHERVTEEPETYLIPQGFVGRAVVYLEDGGGAAVEHDGDRLVFRLGADGVCRTRASSRAISRHRAAEYWYVAPGGARTRIEVLDLGDRNLARDRFGVIELGTSYEGGQVTQRDFLVSTLAQQMRWLDSSPPPR